MAEKPTTPAGRANAHLSTGNDARIRSHGQGRPASRPVEDLTICPACGLDRVYPVDWQPAGRHGWCISLRCPECEWRDAGVFPQEVADRFDTALDAAAQKVLNDLEHLAQANIEAEARLLRDALDADLILPEDF